MKPLSRNALIGYPAGIITGITYGLNPLFGMPLMQQGDPHLVKLLVDVLLPEYWCDCIPLLDLDLRQRLPDGH